MERSARQLRLFRSIRRKLPYPETWKSLVTLRNSVCSQSPYKLKNVVAGLIDNRRAIACSWKRGFKQWSNGVLTIRLASICHSDCVTCCFSYYGQDQIMAPGEPSFCQCQWAPSQNMLGRSWREITELEQVISRQVLSCQITLKRESTLQSIALEFHHLGRPFIEKCSIAALKEYTFN